MRLLWWRRESTPKREADEKGATVSEVSPVDVQLREVELKAKRAKRSSAGGWKSLQAEGHLIDLFLFHLNLTR